MWVKGSCWNLIFAVIGSLAKLFSKSFLVSSASGKTENEGNE